jgi:hypothetical protein
LHRLFDLLSKINRQADQSCRYRCGGIALCRAQSREIIA